MLVPPPRRLRSSVGTLVLRRTCPERKLRQYQKKGQDAGGDSADAGYRQRGPQNGKKGKALLKRHGSKPAGKVKSELKSAEQIRRSMELVEKRKAKNARPTRKKGRR